MLNKNFTRSPIYHELMAMLYSNISIENDVQYTKYMKEISRVDKLIDL